MKKLSRHSRIFIVKALFLMLFALNQASAEEFTLLVSEKIEFKEIPIELVSIGTSGSISLNINKIRASFSIGEQKTISDLNITLIETTEDTARIMITQNVLCLINQDCVTDQPCMQGICSPYKDCIFEKIEGCIEDDLCVPEGTLSEIEKEEYYCSSNYEWQKRKIFNAPCLNNYECVSNVCSNGFCTKNKQETQEKMAPTWILIVFGILLLIKGAFLLYYPEKAKNLFREFSYQKIFNLRALGIVLAILGIALIVWTLA